MSEQVEIGVIGGSGVYEIEGLSEIRELTIKTPFGAPSGKIITGNLGGVNIAFLPRHGKGHFILPSEVPSRANIWALKSIGVEFIIAINSAGSLNEDIAPGTLVIPDQAIDMTKGRVGTYFGQGIVAHVAFAAPFCSPLSHLLYTSAVQAGANARDRGTFLAMEGPAFSTKAESNLYRSWKADVIGMTVMPEAKLAREAEMCYASIACVTDYDCWREQTESVTVEMILDCMRRNIEMAKKTIKIAVGSIGSLNDCACRSALKNAIVTSPEAVPSDTKEKLQLIIGKYIK